METDAHLIDDLRDGAVNVRVNSRAATRYTVLLLVIIGILIAALVFSNEMTDLQLIEGWQLAALEGMVYLTACYNWDRKADVLAVFIRALAMMAARAGLAAIVAFGIGRWWALGSYTEAFAQAIHASQPAVTAQIAYIVLLFAWPFRVMRKPDWNIW